MNQETIGKFIAECRKSKNLTQEQLAEKLGVSNKSISRWENGKTMPDYSILLNLCENLDISVNELFSCEKLSNENFRVEADKNLLCALENSTFNLKEKIKSYRKTWLKKNRIRIALSVAIWIVAMLMLKYSNAEHLIGYFAGMLAVLLFSLQQNNMNRFIENRIYKDNEDSH